LGVINSRLSFIWLKTKGKVKGEILEMTGDTIEQLLIPKLDNAIKKKMGEEIEMLVDRILAITTDEDYLQNPRGEAKVKELERQIDQLVYQLYGLTKEEIAIIEGSQGV
jgi:adenine-specific DNA-methyltransferase